MNDHNNENHKKKIVVMVSRVSEELPDNINHTNNDSNVEKVTKIVTKKNVKSSKPQDQYTCEVASKHSKHLPACLSINTVTVKCLAIYCQTRFN